MGGVGGYPYLRLLPLGLFCYSDQYSRPQRYSLPPAVRGFCIKTVERPQSLDMSKGVCTGCREERAATSLRGPCLLHLPCTAWILGAAKYNPAYSGVSRPDCGLDLERRVIVLGCPHLPCHVSFSPPDVSLLYHQVARVITVPSGHLLTKPALPAAPQTPTQLLSFPHLILSILGKLISQGCQARQRQKRKQTRWINLPLGCKWPPAHLGEVCPLKAANFNQALESQHCAWPFSMQYFIWSSKWPHGAGIISSLSKW